MITAYKGFNSDWTCRDFKYEVGKTYKHDGKAVACKSGFHACENPLNVFDYYPPTGKFAEVHMTGAISREEDGDSKVASAEIYIKVELSLHDFIGRAVKWLTDNAKEKVHHATGYRSAASATGYQSAASATGYQSAASATGDQSAASATGYQSAASATGYRSAASATGYQSAASATGYRSAASATGDQSAASATGDQSAASATGYRSAASATGDQSAASATHKCATAMGSGYKNTVSGINGASLFLNEWSEDGREILNNWAGIVGKNGIKENTKYMLVNNHITEVK